MARNAVLTIVAALVHRAVTREKAATTEFVLLLFGIPYPLATTIPVAFEMTELFGAGVTIVVAS